MSIKTKNSLAAAATVLAVLGLLAAVQLSSAPSGTAGSSVRMSDDGRMREGHGHSLADGRLVEYQ